MNSWDKYELDDFANIFFKNIINVREQELRDSFRNSYVDLELKINEVEKTSRYVRSKKWSEMEYIWNIAGFILTTSLDLKICGEGLTFAKEFGKKEYYIKNSCVIIYEFLEDIEQLLGRKFLDLVKKLAISENLINELKEKKKALSNIKKEHNSSLKNIRKIIGAHRDHNFLLQMETMHNLKDVAFLKLISTFDSALNNLSIPLQKILTEGVNNFVSSKSN